MEKYFNNFEFKVKKLDESSIFEVFEICENNKKYYENYLHENANIEETKTIFTDLPPNTTFSQKFVLGFYNNQKLLAFCDLILNYPNTQSAMIGLLMVDQNFQGQGIGKNIVKKILEVLKLKSIKFCEIGVIDNNIEGLAFWQKMGFDSYSQKTQDKLTFIKMRKKL